MNIVKMFRKLSVEDRYRLTETIQTIGIGVAFGTLEHRKSFKNEMLKYVGDARQILKYLSRLPEVKQKQFYDALSGEKI